MFQIEHKNSSIMMKVNKTFFQINVCMNKKVHDFQLNQIFACLIINHSPFPEHVNSRAPKHTLFLVKLKLKQDQKLLKYIDFR